MHFWPKTKENKNTVFAKHETGQTVKVFVFGTEDENKNETQFRSD